MAAGGGLIWLVRIIGGHALGREAMGFGDVTLMAMIGAFLGWQTCLIVFFLAPLAGVVLGLVQLMLRRGSEIPYGPFLCLGALAAIVGWASIWDRLSGVFLLGWLAPGGDVGLLALDGPDAGRLEIGEGRDFREMKEAIFRRGRNYDGGGILETVVGRGVWRFHRGGDLFIFGGIHSFGHSPRSELQRPCFFPEGFLFGCAGGGGRDNCFGGVFDTRTAFFPARGEA